MASLTPTTRQLRHPPLSEGFYKGLAEKAKGKNIWSPLPADLYRHIYAFLPFANVVEMPTLNSAFAVLAHKHHMVARDLLHRSSPERPLDCVSYLFCKGFGEQMKIQHLKPSNVSELGWFKYDKELTSKESVKEILVLVHELKDSLKSLKIHFIFHEVIYEPDLEKEFPVLSSLTHLDLSEYSFLPYARIKCLVSKCPKLTHLTLPEHSHITDEGLKALAPYCANLEHLSCVKCKHITNQGLIDLVSCCSNLRYLNLEECSKITNKGLVAIAPYCRNLTHLCVPGCTDITDESLEALVPYCGNLRHLNLQGCHKITGAGLANFLSHCPLLTHLKLESSGISNASLKAIIPYCTKLVDLDLSFFSDIGEGFKDLASSCKDLEHLCLFACKHLSYDSTQSIASSCKKLQHLDISYCENLTDAGLQAILENCKQLTDLNVSYCNLLTENGLQAIAKHCPNLTCLNLSYGANATKAVLQAIARGCPNLQCFQTSMGDFTTRDEIERALLPTAASIPPQPGNPPLLAADHGCHRAHFSKFW